MAASHAVAMGVPNQAAPAAPPSRCWPTPTLEYAYYAQVFYSIMGGAIGLSVGGIGAGILGLLGVICLIRMGPYRILIAQAVALPVACGLSFAAVQVLVHGESVLGTDQVRQVLTWIVGLVVVHYVALRPGFLHRCAIATVLLGVSTLPYLTIVGVEEARARLGGGISIANPNDLGAYFGFGVVYAAILGLETRRLWVRAAAFLVAIGCLLVVGLTVSRAPLFAASCSILFAFRRVLRRGFLPFLALVVATWVAYGFGMFDHAADLYQQRGLEESGRLLVWPLALARFAQSPLFGVGVSKMATYVPSAQMAVTPHNGFVYFALTSGIIPVLLFAAYWVQLFWSVLATRRRPDPDAPFVTSLLIYAFLIANNLNEAWMASWMVAIFATVRTGTVLHSTRRAAAAAALRGPIDAPAGRDTSMRGRAVASLNR